nr:MAG: RNA-dependent RNA polymerase [Riboviria sp.]
MGLVTFPNYWFPSVRAHPIAGHLILRKKMLCEYDIMERTSRDRVVDYVLAKYMAKIEPPPVVPAECVDPPMQGMVVLSQAAQRMAIVEYHVRAFMRDYDAAQLRLEQRLDRPLDPWDDQRIIRGEYARAVREGRNPPPLRRDSVIDPRMDLPFWEDQPQTSVPVQPQAGEWRLDEDFFPPTPPIAEPVPSVPSVSSAEEEHVEDHSVASLLRAMGEINIPKGGVDYAVCIEAYAMLAADMMSCTKFADFAWTIYRFIQLKYNISIVDKSWRWIVDVVEEVVAKKSDGVTVQAGLFDASGMRNPCAATWDMMKNSEIVCKLKKVAGLISVLASCAMLKSNPTAAKFAKVWKQLELRATAADLLSQIISGITWIYDAMIPVLSGKMGIMDAFVQVEPARQMDLDFSKFMAHRDAALRDPSFDVAKLEQAYLHLAAMEENAIRLMKNTPIKSDRQTYVSQVIKVGKLKDEFLEMIMAQPLRKAPFSLLLHGSTSVGKSCAVGLLGPVLQENLGVSKGPRYVYNLNGDDKYMSGLQYMTNVIVMDDVANTAPAFVEKAPTSTIIDIINNNPRMAVMADVDSKGKIPICPAAVICTTNDRTLGSHTYSVLPLSVLRRFQVHMTVELKPEFCKEGTRMFNTSVVPSDHRYDIWDLTLEEAVEADPALAQNGSGRAPVTVAYRVLHDDDGPLHRVSMARAMRFIARRSRIHVLQQKALLSEAASIHVKRMCEHGIYEDVCDICVVEPVVDVQAGVLDVWRKPPPEAARPDLSGLWAIRKNACLALLVLKHRRENLGLFAGLQFAYGLMAFASTQRVLECTLLESIGLALVFGILFPSWRLFSALHQRAAQMKSIEVIRLLADVTSFETLITRARARLMSRTVVATMAMFGIACTMAVMGAMVQRRRKRVTPQGSRVSMPERVNTIPRPDPWRTPYVTPVLRNEDTITSTGGQMAALLAKKAAVMKLWTVEGKGTMCVTFPIRTNFWMAPFHVLESDHKMVTIQHVGSNHVNYQHTFVRAGSYTRVGRSDVAIVYVPGKGDQLDLVHYFASSRKLPGGKHQLKDTAVRIALAKLTKAVDQDNNEYIDVRRVTIGANATSGVVQPIGLPYSYEGCFYQVAGGTYDGLCGAPVCTEGSGPMLVGIHSAGKAGTPEGRCSVVTREEVLAAIDYATRPDTAQIQGAAMGNWIEALNDHDVDIVCTNDLPANPYTAYAEGDWEVLGRTSAQKRTFRSNVVTTPMSPLVAEKFGVPRAHGPPAYLDTWLPWNDFLRVTGNSCALPQDKLDLAYLDYKTKIFDGLRELEHLRDTIHPITWDAVVGGADGVSGCYSMNMKASAGFPWSRPKAEFFPLDPEKIVLGQSMPRHIPDWILEGVEALEEKAARGERLYSPHRGNLKDESVKLTKDKVRLFSGSNLFYLMLMRKYYLTILMFMHEQGDLFETAVGVNCCSTQWGELRARATRYGTERMIAGDFADYDKNMSAAMVLAVFKLMIAIARWAGYSERQLRIMETLATETGSPLYEIMSELVKTACSNPAGHPGTVDVNGSGDALYMRTGYYIVKPVEEHRLFHEVASLITYGDDNCMSVVEDAPWFTHTSIQAALAPFGVKYTMPDKNEASRPYVSIREIEFLKRGFVWSKELDQWIAPLNEASIFKMLHTVNKSKTMSMEGQQAELLANANREFFLHGREKFDMAHKALWEIAKELDIAHYLPGCKLQSYGDLVVWLQNQG